MSTTNLPGSSLLAGRYRLVERLGAGGMSVVWRGFDEVLGRQVAVKVLPPSTSTDPSFRRRLRAEAQAAARLTHPHITNVYDYGEATTVDGEPVPYVVMELIDGESLAAVLARVRRLPWQQAVRIMADVAAALAAAHARGIVHRDVTPANVMLTPAGAKVVDFGISALIGENDIDPDGSLLGTPAYLAPERLEGGQVSPATDVYAVGLLIYRTLIGQLPWDVGTTTALLRAHQYTEPDPLPPVEGLPHAVAALVGRCLEKRPDDRPSSAELAHVLAGLSAGAPAVARGFTPDWSDSGEDTTILPPPRSYAMPESVSADAHTPPARNSRFDAFAAAGPEANMASVPALRPSQAGKPGGEPVVPAPREGEPEAEKPAGATIGPLQRPAARRLMVTAGVVAALGVGTAVGMNLAQEPTKASDSANTAQQLGPAVVPASDKCVISYAVFSDAGKEFGAHIIVANRNEKPLRNWLLQFIMPGDQTISPATLALHQQDHEVKINQATTVPAQGTFSMDIRGRYTTANPVPLAFALNGVTCETFVSSKPGDPPRKVQHLADGNTRLGPDPAVSNPLPGISLGPGGKLVITPTTPPPGVVTTAPHGGVAPSTGTSSAPGSAGGGNPGPSQSTSTAPVDPVPVASEPTTAPVTTQASSAAAPDSPGGVPGAGAFSCDPGAPPEDCN